MHFRHRNSLGFFEHGSRVLGYGNANARLSYKLIDGIDIPLGTEYDQFLDKYLELSFNADYEAGQLLADSYRWGIQGENGNYGLGLRLSRFSREEGFEISNTIISTQIENLRRGRLAYLNALESNSLRRISGDSALVYLFHSGQNGLVWHSGYLGLELPNYRETSTSMSIRQNATVDFSRELNNIIDSDSTEDSAIYESPRLDYGFLIGIGRAPFQPVVSVSRFNGSRLNLNFTLPHLIFNVSSDQETPQHLFLTSDRGNAEYLASFIRATEENALIPHAAPDAMNDYARLETYPNLDNYTAALSSENETLAGSIIYSRRGHFFFELGTMRSSIDNIGLFLRTGIPNLMLALNYSSGNNLRTGYESNGMGAQVTGRSNWLYYSLSARGMLINFNQNDQQILWDMYEQDRFRAEFLIGGYF